jgi:hypothetical protein
MNRPRLVRALRIAWSVAWGIACVLLVALWVRSHYWIDLAFVPLNSSSFASFSSMPNLIGVGISDIGLNGAAGKVSTLATEWLAAAGDAWSDLPSFSITDEGITFPYWLPTFLFASIAGVPWLPRRFTLRTLVRNQRQSSRWVV